MTWPKYSKVPINFLPAILVWNKINGSYKCYKQNYCLLFLRGITKPCTQLHPPPPSSTQLQPPPPSSFQPPPSSLQHLQQYLNQNIARKWTISLNLGQKLKSCPFWLKISTHGILEVLILNPDLDFWNSDPENHFWENLDPKN